MRGIHMRAIKTFALVCFLVLIFGTPTYAEHESKENNQEVNPTPELQVPNNYSRPPLLAECDLSERIFETVVGKYKEQPFAKMRVYLAIPGVPQPILAPGIIFVNAETGTFSIVVTFAESNRACIVSTGDGFGPSAEYNKTTT